MATATKKPIPNSQIYSTNERGKESGTYLGFIHVFLLQSDLANGREAQQIGHFTLLHLYTRQQPFSGINTQCNSQSTQAVLQAPLTL